MLPLNFNHFYYFYEVARHGSFTAAARELMISQSSLSIQIKHFETSMGGPLFDRRKTGVILTETGVAAYQVAERVFHEIDQLHAFLMESERQFKGLVSIGTVTSVGIYVLPKILTGFKETYPDVEIKIDFKESDGVLDLLYADKVDFAIIPWDRKFADLNGIRLTQNKMFLVAPPDHPLAADDTVSPRQLEEYPFVGYEIGMQTRSMIDSLFKRMSLSVKYSIESGNSATIKHMVMAGMGMAILPDITVNVEIRRGQLKRIDIPTLMMSRDIMLYHKKNRSLSAAREQFVEFLVGYYKPKKRRRA